jgi:hypothetical protein
VRIPGASTPGVEHSRRGSAWHRNAGRSGNRFDGERIRFRSFAIAVHAV